jgi:tetratricopeptide (TPR) repeat protein
MKHAFLSIAVMCSITALALGRPQADRRGVSVIVVSTETEANQLRARLRAGESFELLAIKYSSGRSALDGGYIGAARVSDLTPEIQPPLQRLKPGEVSAPTKVAREFFLLRWATAAEDSWRSEYQSGREALQQQRYMQAVQSFHRAVQAGMKFGREDPRYARSLLALAETYRLQQTLDEAEPLARQSLAIYEKLLGPEHLGVVASLESIAAIAHARQRYTDAEQMHRRILSIRVTAPHGQVHTDVVEVFEDLAAVMSAGYFRDHLLAEAFEKFEHAIAQAPLRKELYSGIRDGLLRIELVKEAEAVMQHAVRSFPDSWSIRYALAEMYAKAGMVEKAVVAFEEARRLDGPLDPAPDREQRSMIDESIGRMNAFLVRFDDAVTAYKSSLELNPNNHKSLVGLADVYFRRGRLDDALAAYTRVIAASPQSSAVQHGLAGTLLQMGRFSEAATAAQRALELDPRERKSLYVLGIALIRDGHSEQGEPLLQEYERLEANALAAEKQRREILELNRSAAVKLVEGQGDEAIQLFQRALDLHPERADEGRIRLSLALAQAKLGRHREAAETFQAMIDQGASDFLIHRNLAAQYELLGDSRAAEQRAIYLQKFDAALKAILP